MPLQEEDGTGREDAVSFASVSYYETFLEARGLVHGERLTKEQALVTATDWISDEFAEEWRGVPLIANQGLSWPRAGIANPVTGMEYELPWMPTQLVRATCELAYIASTSELRNNAAPNARQVIEKSLPGPVTTKYSPIAPNVMTQSRTFPQIRTMLAPLLAGDGFSVVLGKGW